MNFVTHFNLFGIDAKQIPNITGEGVPTTTTEGAVGCLYIDTLTGDIYKCTAVENGIYTWVLAESAKTRKAVDAFEEIKCNNIFNPNNFESGYYDITTLAPVVSSNHFRTIEPIPVAGLSTLYFYMNFNGDLASHVMCIIALDENGAKVESASRLLSMFPHKYTAPAQARKVHIWVGGVRYGLSPSNICMSLTELEAFEPYYEDTYLILKKSALPSDIVDRENDEFANKTIVNFGDSLFGNYRPPKDISTFIAEKTGATVHNCGFGGCRMASHSIANFDAFGMANLATAITTQNFAVQEAAIAAGKTAATEAEGKLPSYFEETLALLKTIDFSKVDIITIAYGTNDFTGGKTLENESDSYDTTKFAGALRYSIETILNAFPHIRIFICSQTYRFWMDGEGAFTEDSDAKTMSSGLKLTDFVAKTKEVAKSYHLPYVDNYYELGMNKFNRSTYFTATDGTHPNEQGRRLMAEHIAHELF